MLNVVEEFSGCWFAQIWVPSSLQLPAIKIDPLISYGTFTAVKWGGKNKPRNKPRIFGGGVTEKACTVVAQGFGRLSSSTFKPRNKPRIFESLWGVCFGS